ncbi:MAG: hypothetical protein J6D28_00910 [Bacilli bacterium]|nr:hypothetical protein [Bacilli bacterium]MBP3920106.1 hypothetical protein [Bacilli bacterium]
MQEKDEIQLYYLVCDISKICKDYFYERKYLPQDAWSMETVVKSIYQKSKTLNSKYNEIKKEYKKNK